MSKLPVPSASSGSSVSGGASGSVIRIKPNHYIHVTDSNTAIATVVVGPQTFTKQEHEVVSAGPLPSIMIPPRHYCVIQNPVVRTEKGEVLFDKNGLVKLRHGNEEIRFAQDPFPLFPGEKLGPSGITPLQVVNADCALMLRCLRPFVDGTDPKVPVNRNAGDEWIFKGPATYIPRVEVQVVEVIKSMVVVENTALKLRAKRAFKDRKKVSREAGEEWLWRETGAFLPDVDEEVLGVVKATVLTDKKALHLRATHTFTDVFGVKRQAGDEWLVTIQRASTHIPDVYEQLVGEADVLTLTSRQYCVILDPFDGAKQHYGQKLLRRGECSFFLNPGETLEKGIQKVIVLGEEEALLLTATEDVVEGGVARKAGHRWMVYGPRDYIPPIQVQVIETRKTIPLDQNEGVYVRNIKSGKIVSVIGESYMLKPDEELWSKPLSPHVEALLEKQGRDDHHDFRARDKTRVVSYRAPHNSAVQVYDYQRNFARVVFGPELVILAPDEEFTILNLSGGVPKKTGQIKSISLLLGPDFMTDVTIVETSDHARLSLKLSYNWYFDVSSTDKAACAALFAVPDFVGDACKAIASLVRAAVASTTFDDFHKHSASIIRRSAFGLDANGKVNDKLRFNSNRLVITNIDIQSVEPVDQRTRDALQKSVQLAIEITTKSQEASARHEAERLEQEAKGKLERQRIEDEAEAEKARKDLVALQAASKAVLATGDAIALARAKAEAQEIEGEASVKQAELASSAAKIQGEAELASLKNKHMAEVENARALMELEVTKAKEMAEIETAKMQRVIESIGADTLKAMAEAGPAMQAKLLEGLGLSSCMITDGNSPINLFQTAQGMLEQSQQ